MCTQEEVEGSNRHCTRPTTVVLFCVPRSSKFDFFFVEETWLLRHCSPCDRMVLVRIFIFQVASKTNDAAGDGTTTATVLTRAIFREGCKVDSGYTPSSYWLVATPRRVHKRAE